MTYEEDVSLRGKKTWESLCQHMKNLIMICEDMKVKFDGCGDCGSPWLTCEECDLTIENASMAFDRPKEI